MQLQGQRWKKLIGSQSSSNIDQKQSQDRSKSKKYVPKRQANLSELNSMTLKHNRSRVTSNDASQPRQAERSIIMKSSFIKNQQNDKLRSPTRSDSDRNLLQPKLRQSISSTQQLASPTVLMKQLVKINKNERQQQQKQNIPTKVLFSLDQEHRYIHEQLNKIKEEFVKLKQLVRNQYVRQKKEVDDIVKGLISKFEEVIYIRNLNTVQSFKETAKVDKPSTINKMNSPSFSLNLDCLKQLKSLDSMQQNQFGSLNISEIKPKSSIKDSLFQLKKVFCDDSVNLQKSISKISEVKTIQTRPFHKMVEHSAKTDRCMSAKNENAQPYPRLNTDRSKKQFQKLFQAVNSLKKDIKDLNTITISVPTEKPLSQSANPSQGLTSSASLIIANEKKVEVPKLSKLAAYKKAKLDAMEK